MGFRFTQSFDIEHFKFYLKEFQCASQVEQSIFIAAWFFSPGMTFLANHLSLEEILKCLDQIPRKTNAFTTDLLSIEKWVSRAFNLHWYKGQCLPQALFQYAIHVRLGDPVQFCMGIEQDDSQTEMNNFENFRSPKIVAHAWIENITFPRFSHLSRMFEKHSPPAR